MRAGILRFEELSSSRVGTPRLLGSSLPRAGVSRLGGLVISLALLTGPLPLNGQVPRVRMEVDTAVVTVGDRLTLRVSVDHAADSQVRWPDSLNLAPFEVLSAQASPPSTTAKGARSALTLTLTTFELGDLEIPSFDLEVIDPDGEGTTLGTNRYGVRVVSVGLDEEGDIRDVKGPLAIPLSPRNLFLMALATILAIALAYAVYRRFRKRASGRVGPVREVPRRPPHEVALAALARLEASPLLERGEVKEFHIQVSEILRTYVEDRFQVPALEMTTSDTLAGMEKVGFEVSLREEFGSFLHPCDMVKFAKHRPSADASLDVLALGRHLVESTIPVPEPEVGSAQPDPGPSAGDGKGPGYGKPQPTGNEIPHTPASESEGAGSVAVGPGPVVEDGDAAP